MDGIWNYLRFAGAIGDFGRPDIEPPTQEGLMKVYQLVLKEIFHRKLNYAVGVFAVLVATASLVGSMVLLRMHDIRTDSILRSKEAQLQTRMDKLKDDTRKSMLKLGFNLVILPKDQNLADWHENDYSVHYMPESYADRLARSEIVSVRHILPSLQQKIKWPEHKRTIILMGTRGEVPNLHLSPQKPLIQPVEAGSMILGYGLHQNMNIKVNDQVQLMGKMFKVKTCYGERGNKDDITAWIHLKEAQELLGKQGQINAILALECLCTGNSLPIIRKEVTAILPGTQVIERQSSVLARAEARTQVAQEAAVSLDKEARGRQLLRDEREHMISVLAPLILLACALWVAITGFVNVRSRLEEIGILRAIGVASKDIFMLFIWKHISVGILGGFIGLLVGSIAPVLFANAGHAVRAGDIGSFPFWLRMSALALLGASLLAVIAGWIPAMIASRQDPAEILREE
jgi:heme/copper-type cytochrome/quinol oxidase subunit 4